MDQPSQPSKVEDNYQPNDLLKESIRRMDSHCMYYMKQRGDVFSCYCGLIPYYATKGDGLLLLTMIVWSDCV